MASAEQAAILATHAGRWYVAHLLLFLGMMLFVPGLLALWVSGRPPAGARLRGAHPGADRDGRYCIGLRLRDARRPVRAGRSGLGVGRRPAREHALGADGCGGRPGHACLLLRHGHVRSTAGPLPGSARPFRGTPPDRGNPDSRRDRLRPGNPEPDRKRARSLRERLGRSGDPARCPWRNRRTGVTWSRPCRPAGFEAARRPTGLLQLGGRRRRPGLPWVR